MSSDRNDSERPSPKPIYPQKTHLYQSTNISEWLSALQFTKRPYKSVSSDLSDDDAMPMANSYSAPEMDVPPLDSRDSTHYDGSPARGVMGLFKAKSASPFNGTSSVPDPEKRGNVKHQFGRVLTSVKSMILGSPTQDHDENAPSEFKNAEQYDKAEAPSSDKSETPSSLNRKLRYISLYTRSSTTLSTNSSVSVSISVSPLTLEEALTLYKTNEPHNPTNTHTATGEVIQRIQTFLYDFPEARNDTWTGYDDLLELYSASEERPSSVIIHETLSRILKRGWEERERGEVEGREACWWDVSFEDEKDEFADYVE
jgi:hypothetical protein